MNLVLYAVLALAVMGMIGTGVYQVKEWGADEVRAEWAEANRVAKEVADRLAQERALEARKTVIAAQQAERKAKNYETKWRQTRNVLRDVPLAVCPTPSASPPDAAGAILASPGPVLSLTWAYVLQHDSAWTGPDGEPLWPDSGGTAERPLAAPSPVTLDQALETHQANASRCSENSRQLGRLIALIKKLRE